MLKTTNRYYGATGYRATMAYCRNALNFTGRSTRSECFWLTPWLVLSVFFALACVTLAPALLLGLSFAVSIPNAALMSRRYRDAGLCGWLGACQAVFTNVIWWMLVPNAGYQQLSILVGNVFLLWLINVSTHLVCICLPTTARQSDAHQQKAYRQTHQLSASDLDLFKATMDAAKMQIKQLERHAKTNAQIKSLLNESGGLQAAQALFRDLVQHPKEMPAHADWLYHTLPTLAATCDRLKEIANGTVMTADIQASIAQMAQSITDLSKQLAADYAQVIQDDVSDLQSGVTTYQKPQRAKRWDTEYNRLFAPSTRRRKKRRATRASLIWVTILFVILGVRMLTRAASPQSSASRDRQSTVPYVYPTPLKAAKIKARGPIDLEKNLVATYTDGKLAFNNGFVLTFGKGFKFSPQKTDFRVSPSTSANADQKGIGTLNVQEPGLTSYIDVKLYGNVVDDLNAYHLKGEHPVIKVFPQPPLGDTQSGYIFDVPDSKADKSYGRLSRYFLFPDGTAVVLRNLPDRNDRQKQLTKHSNLAAFKAAFPEDFAALEAAATLSHDRDH